MSREGRPASGPGLSAVSRVLAALWLLGAVVTWNAVFDAHIVKGARDYVDGQQLFIDGRGPRLDMDRAMAEARSSGLRHAWGWSGAELAAGAVLWFVVRARRKAGPRAGDPARSGHA